MDKIIQLLQLPMSCEERARNSFLTALLTSIKNGSIESFEKSIDSPIKTRAFSMIEGVAGVNVVESWEMEDSSLPENSVAVIYLEGMVYPWKTYRVENLIAIANANPKILGVLLFMNTPGGYVLRVDILTEAIKNSIKPVAAYVTGMCASAGEHIASGVRRIFSASRTDIHGSIGTMTSFVDDSKFWEDNGIVVRDIYASLSTMKNDRSREAEKGNDAPIIADLDFFNNLFIQTISKNRGIAVTDDNPVFKGSVFFTEEAINQKLVDEIGDFETALNWVLNEGLKNEANNKY